MKREFPVPDPELVGSELYLTPYIGQTLEFYPYPLLFIQLFGTPDEIKPNLH